MLTKRYLSPCLWSVLVCLQDRPFTEDLHQGTEAVLPELHHSTGRQSQGGRVSIASMLADRQAGRQTGRQADKQAGRQADITAGLQLI